MSNCAHTYIIKRPETGPGASSAERPGEWFCNDCPETWPTYETAIAAAVPSNRKANPRD